MTDMKRLFDGPLSADAARILRSAESDAPSAAEEKQARIIGAYGSMPSPVAPSPVAPHAGALDALFRGRKWAALAATIVVAGFFVSSRSTTETAAPRPSITTNTAPPVAPLPPPAAEQSVRVEDLPAAPEIVASAAARRAPPPIGVEDELVAIDTARAALAAGRSTETLARIAEWRTKFPRPRYAEEADALEVQALSATGRRDEARAKAALFFASHPSSPYDKRIRTAIGDVQP
ncbi:MAG: hypothetical protein JWM82_2856 [Myxococcales bacterium]|nr:hypothetical protein [Myxococcales bacterium]